MLPKNKGSTKRRKNAHKNSIVFPLCADEISCRVRERRLPSVNGYTPKLVLPLPQCGIKHYTLYIANPAPIVKRAGFLFSVEKQTQNPVIGKSRAGIGPVQYGLHIVHIILDFL